MNRICLFAAVVAFTLAGVCVEAKETKIKDEHTWAGFAPGSWVIINDIFDSGEHSIIKGNKFTLEKYRDGRPVVTHIRLTDKLGRKQSVIGHYGQTPQTLGMTKGEVAEEEVEIGNQTLTCTRTTYTIKKENPQREIELTLWTNDKINIPLRAISAPGQPIALMPNVVKAQMKAKEKNKSYSTSVIVKELGVKAKIDGKEYEAIRESRSVTVTQKSHEHDVAIESEYVLSEAVPGHVVSMISKGKIGEMAIAANQTVAKFHAVRITTKNAQITAKKKKL